MNQKTTKYSVLSALFIGLFLSFISSKAAAKEVINNTKSYDSGRESKSISDNISSLTATSLAVGKNSNDRTQELRVGARDRPLKVQNNLSFPSSDLVSQVTSVSQLSDVQSTDWAFQALQSLVERYEVIAGYPDASFRGNRAMTRYEFASALNAALKRVNELIAAGSGDRVTPADLATLQKLQAEFATELSTLRGRIDALEAITARLEANQFSTTTKLEGTALFAVSDAFGGEAGDDNNTVLQQRVRLYFETSFTGQDQLTTRLDYGNLEEFDLPTEEGRFGFETNTEGSVELGDLEYVFPLGDRVTVFLEMNDSDVHNFTDVINPFFSDSDTGAVSRFARRNPIYRLPNTNAGIGARFKLSEAISFDFGYLAGEANNSNSGSGLFNGDYGAIAQLTLTQGDRLAVGFTYIHSYSVAGQGLESETGSESARLDRLGPLELERPVVANSYGIEANYRVSNSLAIGGWIGYTNARASGLGDAQIWNYALTMAFPDLGKEGNLGGIVVGMQPKLAGTSRGLRAVGQLKDPDTSLHIEGFYRYQLTDNIAITPGIIWLTAPNHNENNDDIVIGTIRTTFEF